MGGPGSGGHNRPKPKPNRVCEVCGKEFYVPPSRLNRSHNTGRFCSNECKGLGTSGKNSHFWNGGPISLTCENCGRSYEVTLAVASTSRHCSKQCLYNTQKASKKACINCGKEQPHQNNKYCSMKCRVAVEQGSNSPKWKGGKKTTRVCESCSKEFQANKYDVEKGMGKFCSQRCFVLYRSQYMAEQTHTYARGGTREDVGIYVRSSWEANWARYLNFLVSIGDIERWEYEPDTFEFHKIKKGSRFYTPDFKVFYSNSSFVYHEVKGYMDQKSQTKLNRMAKYYPDTTIILVDKNYYYAIASQIGKSLPNWESKNTKTPLRKRTK